MAAAIDTGSLRIFRELTPDRREALSQAIEEVAFETGSFVVHQHDEAQALYVLLSGAVEFLMSVEGVDELVLGATDEPGALIGWSVVREPHRYTASVRCSEPCRILRLPRSALVRVLEDDPHAGCQILRAIADALIDRLDDARSLLGHLPKSGPRE